MKIGILGGAFDPIHLGHLAAASAAIECAGLDRILFIPTGVPPHRRQTLAGPEHRLAMARLAVAGDKRFDVSDLEIARGGLSYTADTLEQLQRLYADDQLFLILGWDAARLFRTWHAPERVRRLATVVIISRPGSGPPDAAAVAAAGLDPERTVVCLRKTPDVSASSLRRALRRGERVTERVPEPVAAYIDAHGLYRGGDGRG